LLYEALLNFFRKSQISHLLSTCFLIALAMFILGEAVLPTNKVLVVDCKLLEMRGFERAWNVFKWPLMAMGWSP